MKTKMPSLPAFQFLKEIAHVNFYNKTREHYVFTQLYTSLQ